ncbi:MAG: phosphoribosylformylglycinamidine synthase [Thermodesulfovibrionales bacterium]|nr:phosphoribosylformylglycinamidine synthase [Thermodesulfovibrionales bacterium]
MSLFHLYRRPALSFAKKNELLSIVRQNVSSEIRDIETEYCFNIETTAPLTGEEFHMLRWLLAETFEPENFSGESFLTRHSSLVTRHCLFEVGPRMNFTTAWSTNAVSVCHACGLTKITRIERSRRYKLMFEDRVQGFKDSRVQVKKNQSLESLNPRPLDAFLNLIHDRMTECPYPEPLTIFETGIKPESVFLVSLIEEGKEALRKINTDMGLGLDDWDIDYYYNLFVNDIGRNPTNVECFDLGQSNSEHSRHWFFKGRLIIDGEEMPNSLMDIIKQPLSDNPGNSVIAFKDNSSAIRGYEILTIIPEHPGKPSRFRDARLNYHIIFTAETHNFPTGVAPFPGAETGTGGRIRDVHATGRGSLVIAGTAAYCVGNLLIPGYPLSWEDLSFEYPPNLATPLQIEIEASNGASDYGNKFGEPVIQGFTRSFGLRLPNGERREWVKPIMFTGGVGQIDNRHIEKGKPERGMLVVKIGGPAYRIGIGGGAASSVLAGELTEELDFNAVQRGDAEMEQKVNRVIRACVEMGDENPVISIHDQGAGGNSNVIKEIIYPEGARIEVRNILVGDDTLSVLEIWGAEYQENDALLIEADRVKIFMETCKREKVPCSIIGEITGDGYIVLHDEIDRGTPVNLELSKVLGEMPQKTFNIKRIKSQLEPLKLPDGIKVRDALERVLRLVSVGSKRFLTNKVDRSVTGLIAQQQCVGPLQLTLSNVSVVSQSHFVLTGAAIAIGEQPIKGLISPQAMARMSVGEALTNILWAKVSALEDIKCSGNWMWAAKLPGEGARLYNAAVALRDIMIELGIAIDGGKDSLSMAAVVPFSGKTEVVKAPGSLVISAYVTCPNITKVVAPDIKRPGESRLFYIDLGKGKYRMGGTALAHVYGQIGNESPDLDDPQLLKRTFNAIQRLISEDLILSGHDRSDGGLITTLLEMAFSGNCGLEINIKHDAVSGVIRLRRSQGSGVREKNSALNTQHPALSLLFSEELGLVIEYIPDKEDEIISVLKDFSVPYQIIGRSLSEKRIRISFNDELILNEDMRVLRDIWEETSYHLDRLQANPECVNEERKVNFDRKGPPYLLKFNPQKTPQRFLENNIKPKVAIVREEGSNGDREMTSAFYQAGFEVWDITMVDLLESRANLDDFRGIAFVGGFSYADVLDSAKGWAGVIRFNKKLYEQFERFYERPDTFSLGVCNGCQLIALLGWVPWKGIPDRIQPRFIHNKSGRFESRFSTVHILPSPAIMLRGMEGSTLGVWIAHGEGRVYFPGKEIMQEVQKRDLAPIRFIDDNGEFTETYPLNPNGSPFGITALCSPDGRHLAMMPHPERTFLKWQWAYMPKDWKKNLDASPWLRMFQNAMEWCEGNKKKL